MRTDPIGPGRSPPEIGLCLAGWQIEKQRLNRTWKPAAADVMPGIDPATLILAQGSTLIDELNDRIVGDMGRSLRTTGASNGQTIAGACATGTHGSVLNAGGIQDHLRAVHIVTP